MRLRSVLIGLIGAGAALAADQSVTLKVGGWRSKGDGYKAEAAARSVKGVKSATADVGKKELAVVFDDAVATRAQVEKAVKDAGYTLAP
jgi:copper chaperone CopZ